LEQRVSTNVIDLTFVHLPAHEGRLILDLEFVNDQALQSPFSMPRLIESFVRLGKFGGFAGDRHDPARSSISLESSQIIDKVARWSFLVDNCHPGIVAVLRNLVLFSHQHVAPMRMGRLHSSLASDGQLVPPPRSHFSPSNMELAISIESDDMSICVLLDGNPEPQVQSVESILNSWATVVAARGLGVHEADLRTTALVIEEEAESFGHEVWLRLSEVNIEEADLGPLINALQGAQSRGCRVLRVDAS
jgi:hypothetical protein